MRRSGVWGGELEMVVLSRIAKIKFLLYLSDGKVLTVSKF